MKLAASVQPVNDLQNLIKSRFAEFNRQSSPSRGRKYPPELRELICRGSAAGIGQMDLKRLSGMSDTAIRGTLAKAKAKPVASRRLEVVDAPSVSEQRSKPLIVRFPSGVTIELADATLLTATLLGALGGLEVNHAASC
jgi:hypothetical protein